LWTTRNPVVTNTAALVVVVLDQEQHHHAARNKIWKTVKVEEEINDDG
jgi:hypothetical protein